MFPSKPPISMAYSIAVFDSPRVNACHDKSRLPDRRSGQRVAVHHADLSIAQLGQQVFAFSNRWFMVI